MKIKVMASLDSSSVPPQLVIRYVVAGDYGEFRVPIYVSNLRVAHAIIDAINGDG